MPLSLNRLENSASRSANDVVRRRDELLLGAISIDLVPIGWRKVSLPESAPSSDERVRDIRNDDSELAENVSRGERLLVKVVVSKSGMSGMVSDGGRYVVDAEPDPVLITLLVTERIVLMEPVGDLVEDRSGGATERSKASLY